MTATSLEQSGQSETTIMHTLSVTTTAQQVPFYKCRSVYFAAAPENTDIIYIGNSQSVVLGNGTPMLPGGGVGFDVNRSDRFWIISNSGTQEVTCIISSSPEAIQYSSGLPLAPSGVNSASGTIGATATEVKASGGQLYGWYIYNSNSSAVYCQIFNATAANVSLGSTSPVLSFGIPASSPAQSDPDGTIQATYANLYY